MICDKDKKIQLKPGGIKFPTLQILPEGMWPENRRYTMILLALHFQESQIGFVLFEAGTKDWPIYEILRAQISSALQGALLVGEILELNEKLKDENVRMHAEMQLAHRIQTSLLPNETNNLHQDFEISARMLPAESVGGDYYNISIDKSGDLWIAIGDVSGHGITPGLIMMMTQTIHTTITTNTYSRASEMVCKINKILYKNVSCRLKENHYMTFSTLKYLGKGLFSICWSSFGYDYLPK